MHRLPFKSKILPIAITQALLATSASAALVEINLAADDSLVYQDTQDQNATADGSDVLGGISIDDGISVTLGNNSTVTTGALANGLANDSYANVLGIYAYSYDNNGDVTVTLNNGASVSATAQAASNTYGNANSQAIYTYTDTYYDTVATAISLDSAEVNSTADSVTQDESNAYARGIYARAESNGDHSVTIDLANSQVAANAVASGTTYVTAEAEAITIQSSNKYLDRYSADNTVTLSDSAIEASAIATSSDHAYSFVTAVSIDGRNYDGTQTVELNNSSIDLTAEATGIDSSTGDAYAYAEGIQVYNYAYNGGQVNVSLNNDSTITGSITADSAGEDASAYAEAIFATSISYYDGNDTGVTVTLDNSSIDLSVSATGYSSADAYAEGIISNSAKIKYGNSTNITTLTDSSITLSASAATGSYADSSTNAGVYAIEARSSTKYYGSTANLTVTLSGSSIDQTATSTQEADDERANAEARGIIADGYSYYGDTITTVSLSNTTLSQSATATGSGSGAEVYAETDAIEINSRASYNIGYGSSTVSLSLSDTTLDASATASSGDSDYANVYSYSYGVHLSNNSTGQGDTTVTINQSEISNITSSTVGNAYGFQAYTDIESLDLDTVGVTADSTITISNTTVIAEGTITTGNGSDSARSNYASGYADSDIENLKADADPKYYGELSTMTVTLTDSTFIARSTINAGSASYLDADAENLDIDASSYANANNSVTLNNVQVTGEASVTGAGGGEGIVNGTEAYSDTELLRMDTSISYSGGYTPVDTNRQASTTVTLSGSTLEGSAETSLTSGDYNRAYADFDAMRVRNNINYNDTGDSLSSTTVTLTNSTINGSATATTGAGDYTYADADSVGIHSSSFLSTGGATPASSDVNTDINLTDSSITLSATASGDATNTGYADAAATGIYAEAQNYLTSNQASVTVNLNNSSVDVTAGATNSGGYAYAYATGIYVQTGGDSNINLSDSSITVTANASGATSEGGAYGIHLSGGNADISLENTDITATGINATGVMSEGGADFTLTLDNNSSITGTTAIFAPGVGKVINGGLINGDTQVDILNVTGTQRGTATVNTLNVAGSGTLSATLTPATNNNQAHFNATNANLLDGAGIELRIGGIGSSIATPATASTYEYLIVSANNLTVDRDQLDVFTNRSLVQAEVSDGYTINDISVTLSLADFEQLVAANGGSANASSVAASSQQALLNVAGTQQGEELFDLLETINTNDNWEQLITPAHGGNVAALMETNRLLSNAIQSGLTGNSSGQNSGDDISARNGFWAQAIYSESEMDDVDNVAGFESDTSGLTLGYGRDINDNFTVGAALTYADSDTDGEGSNRDNVETETWMGSLYSQYQRGQWFSDAVLSYGSGDNDGSRYVAGSEYTAEYDSDILSVIATIGYDLEFGKGWMLAPRGELRYTSVEVDGYTEEGGLAALQVDDQDYDVMEIVAGIDMGKAFETSAGIFTPHLDLALYHDLEGDDIQINSRFLIGGNDFVVNGADKEDTSFSATAGTDWDISDTHTLRFDYQYFGNSDFSSNSVLLRYNYTF